ncbi:MAG: alpha/beta hydrolase [Atribacterota bacterium]
MVKRRQNKKYLFLILMFTIFFFLFFSQNCLAQIQWNNIQIHTDINYAAKDTYEYDNQSKAHLLDMYQPEDCQSCPVIIYIHGGTWVLGDKGGLSYKAKAFTYNNYIYVSINYRLSPDYQFPAHAYDVAQAFSWVKNNIQEYGGNPEQIYLMGHSAGGHLAALISLDESYLAKFDLTPSDINGVIGLDSAAYHLPSLFSNEPENQYLFSWAFGDNLQDWEAASPINHIKKGKTIPPFLLLVADGREVSKTVNENFTQKLREYGYNATIFHFPNKDHISIDYDLGKENDPVFPVILNWLRTLSDK